jgi:thiol-disulfide isomerase/thioredoxin
MPLPALADDDSDAPVAHGILSKNAIAKTFTQPLRDKLPDVMVETRDGKISIAELVKGRTVLMPVWAEWCVPCLIEIPDFARLHEVYGNDKTKFSIVPVLSGTRKQLTLDIIANVFSAVRANVFAPIIEQDYGDRLLRSLARKADTFAIPCNMLIAPSGKVYAREIGLDSNGITLERDEKNPYAPAEKAAAGHTLSLWGTAAGDEFASAMSNGFLDGA